MLVAPQIGLSQDAQKVAPSLQAVSVTVMAGTAMGSGVLITRELIGADGQLRKYNFVLTCGHVVAGLKTSIITETQEYGQISIQEWQEAEIKQVVVKNGRIVGTILLKAEVIFYSGCADGPQPGQDLALLLIKGNTIIDEDTKFYCGNDICGVGTDVLHVGSARGQHHSVTTGIISFVGREINFDANGTRYFDQICVSALPGSSGGGVWTEDGKYVGMLVRQVAENFNLMIPMRRIKTWADLNNASWIYNPESKCKPLNEIQKSR